MVYLGIDLGTANTIVAAYGGHDSEPILQEFDGNKAVPSFAYFEPESGYPTVGEAARTLYEQSGDHASRCFRRWKLQMGGNEVLTKAFAMTVGGAGSAPVTPENLTTALVQYLVQEIGEGLDGDVIEGVVVTTPNGWRLRQPHKCAATRRAAEAARLPGGKAALPVASTTLSEPVAAAIYAIRQYRQKSPPEAASLWGEPILVCDMGAGTFDVSEVEQARESAPVHVGEAENTVLAGDFADALLCRYVIALFDEAHGTTYGRALTGPAAGGNPIAQTNAFLQGLYDGASDIMFPRVWMGQTRRWKEKLSLWRGRAQNDAAVVAAAEETFLDDNGASLSVALRLPELYAILEPFYDGNRRMLEAFLKRRGRNPFAVLLCGGGSHIVGVQERIIQLALATVYSQDEAETMLSRLPINRRRTDQIIALGAALVAGGAYTVREHLMADTGVVISYHPLTTDRPAALVQAEKVLGLSNDTSFLLTPLLSKGEELPAEFSSDTITNMTFIVPTSGEFVLRIIVQDTPPHIEQWTIAIPEEVRNAARYDITSVRWYLRVDVEGNIAVTMAIKGAREELRYNGVVHRERAGGDQAAPDFLQGSLRDDLAAGDPAPPEDRVSVTLQQWNDLSKAAKLVRSWQAPSQRA